MVVLVVTACGRVAFDPRDDAGPTTCIRELAVGDRITCIRRADSSVSCAGWNIDGQLGQGDLSIPLSAMPLDVLDGPGGPRAMGTVQVMVGNFSLCTRRTDGSVWCWGANTGQLITGDGVIRSSPYPSLPPSSVTRLGGGIKTFCAIRADHTLACWGQNNDGQAGVGGLSSSVDTPMSVVSLPPVSSVAGGRYNTCARALADGALYCWGANASGQIGDGTTTPRLVPTPVVWSPGGAGVREMVSYSLGREHACGLDGDGRVWCWGAIRSSRVRGTSNVTTVFPYGPSPVAITSNAQQLASGYGHVCALDRDTTVTCWGSNSHGQLGDGTMMDRPTPVHVIDTSGAPLTGVVEIAAGARSKCARTSDDAVWCWGWNV